MRDYGRVHSSFWTSQTTRSLSDDARTLAFYLLTSPHTTLIGAFRLPDGYVSEDLQWGIARVQKGLEELFRKGFAKRCETTKWVWICRFLHWNTPENPNQWKAARKLAAQIPDECAWKPEFQRVFAEVAGDPVPDPPNRSETVPQPFRNQEQEQEQKQEQEQEKEKQSVERERSTAGGRERSESIERIFRHWQQVHHHPHAKLDEKRRKVIRRALELGYSEADLCQAISGYRNSPHHMGQNETGTVYDSIELMLRDAKHIDAGLKFYAEPPRSDLSALTRRNVEATADWVPPEMRHATG